MTTEAWVFAALVWLTLALYGAIVLYQKGPKRRKPVDELEAAIAAQRNRVVDLEDRLEHFVKREAVRVGREKKEQGELSLGVSRSDREVRLQAARARAKLSGILP